MSPDECCQLAHATQIKRTQHQAITLLTTTQTYLLLLASYKSTSTLPGNNFVASIYSITGFKLVSLSHDFFSYWKLYNLQLLLICTGCLRKNCFKKHKDFFGHPIPYQFLNISCTINIILN